MLQVCCAGGYGYGAGLGYAGLGYGAGLGYAGLGYGYGLAAPVATGYGVSNVANTVGIAGVAPAALPALAGGYAGAGKRKRSADVHVPKREAGADAKADAEADTNPDAKADTKADAKANRDADAGLLYGAYGYGAGLGHA